MVAQINVINHVRDRCTETNILIVNQVLPKMKLPAQKNFRMLQVRI